MPGAARLNDIGSGHDCFPETPIIEGSPDVIINGQPAARQGDTVLLHGCPCPNAPDGVHSRKIAEGSSTVIINGKPAARIGDGINCGGVLTSGSGNVIIGDTPYKSPVQECARQAALNRAPLLALTPRLTVPPVYAKSCLQDKGCIRARTEKEPVENFGDMVLFAQPEQDDCCGYGHHVANNPPEVVQYAQAAKKIATVSETAISSPKPFPPKLPPQEPWYKTLFDLLTATDDKPLSQAPIAKSLTGPVVAEKQKEPVAGADVGLLAATGVMTQVWGEWSLGGVLSAARGVPYIGALASALYIPSAGEGSDKVPGRDEHWLESELRRKGWAGETATTRVRFFWRPDIHGNIQVYGVHTGEGTPYEGVRVANMVWDAKIQSYTFTPAPGLDGPTITWTPEKPEGAEPVTHTGSPVKPIDQPTILIYPIPKDETETTTPPFPVPDAYDFNDWILVFPDGSEIKPIYVYLQSARNKPGTVTGKGEVLSGESKWLEAASSGLGAPVPAQVADKLRGQKFERFDDFREAFWLAVAERPELIAQFNGSNKKIIQTGGSPFVPRTESAGKRVVFEIHHVKQIQHDGPVYDVDNLRVNTPKNHIDIHKGKGETSNV
ncbi:S-type Pyocin [Pectobacterium polaris]|uniref:S-type pyocin domain-containing protein n=1 Tax=Pectobacterium polaris TaxID=2042057 RepID=UPI000D61E6E2|nr:S-type pyocin domain-containing protein [Pectobacterium polaris]MCU1789361.1 S-type Pyocin [Pectobacterium polaris]PWD56311.1 S-type Pyocin [Pectobacterium polaris]